MKKTLLLTLAAFALFLGFSPMPVGKSIQPHVRSAKPANAPSRIIQAVENNTSQPADMSQKTNRDSSSIDEVGQAVAKAIQSPANLRELLEGLKKSGQEPFVIRDVNPDTGEMLIVRTKAPLPGTRYFHAQYFTDDGGERFIQHASFEFEPTPEAMQMAIQSVERNFSGLSRPVVQREDYVKWKLGDDYIVWVKKMDTDDLKDDPFNAYTAADRGTIRVAVELEVHGD